MKRRSIQCLDEHLINIIAAGEVVENPASCIKELVENSIDAGSSAIHIEIKGGGFDTIRIMDDGIGMPKEDAVLCFERHATSKIKSKEDLKEIATLGFRGEALSSISSIAHVFMKTAPKEGGAATLVEMRGGKCLKVDATTRENGTTIEIFSLFFNVPARLEFQKSVRGATMDITKMVHKLLLCNPNIRFTYTIDQQVELSVCAAEDYIERAKQVLGVDLVSNMIPFSFDEEGVRCYGLIERMDGGQRTRSQQYFFINQRTASSPIIQSAAAEAYQKYFPPKVHPALILFLDFSHALVDVNVHPQKSVVRLKDEKNWFKIVQKALDAPFFSIDPIFDVQFEQIGVESAKNGQVLPWNFTLEKNLHPVFKPHQKSLALENKPQKMVWDVQAVALLEGYLLALKEQRYILVDLSKLELFTAKQQMKNFDTSIQKDYLERVVKLQNPIHLSPQELEEKLLPFGILGRFFSKTAILIEGLAPCIDPQNLDQIVGYIFDNGSKSKEKIIDYILEKRRTGYMKKDLFIATSGFIDYLQNGGKEGEVFTFLSDENLKRCFLCKG